MADLSRYMVEVGGIADELGALLADRYGEALRGLVSGGHGEDLLRMTEEETEKALKLLSQTPSQRERSLKRLDDLEAATLVLRARYLGIASQRAMGFSEEFDYVRGKGYRAAAEYGARALLSASLFPTIEEVLPEEAFEEEYPHTIFEDMPYLCCVTDTASAQNMLELGLPVHLRLVDPEGDLAEAAAEDVRAEGGSLAVICVSLRDIASRLGMDALQPDPEVLQQDGMSYPQSPHALSHETDVEAWEASGKTWMDSLEIGGSCGVLVHIPAELVSLDEEMTQTLSGISGPKR